MPTPSAKILVLLLGTALLLTGCPDKKPKGGAGAKTGGNPPPAAPKKGKPSKKGAQDDLEADAKKKGDTRLSDGEERLKAERERQRSGLSQTPPTDGRGTSTATQPPNFGQLPPTGTSKDPNLQSPFSSSGNTGNTGNLGALPGLPPGKTEPPKTGNTGDTQPPQPRGVRSEKTHQ